LDCSKDGSPVRKKVLQAGRTLLLEGGLRAVTTAEIARRARVSKKTLYAVFPTKDELLAAIVLGFQEELIARWDEILDSPASAIDRTLASLEFITHFLPQIEAYVVNQQDALPPTLWDRIDAVRVERLHKLKELLEAGQEEGMIRPEMNPEHWILLLVGTVRSTLTPQVSLQTGISLTELVKSVQAVYFDGLLTEKGKQYVARQKEDRR
jgi:AcrR family transcriptional regulator